ncbi:MAG: efflux RND transporter periplasmic adaptor subunit [Deferrisomatales bacterium]|nr:efflux RND transporter periplasmic adaptor subunit [Deferrisomatales bacterium]
MTPAARRGRFLPRLALLLAVAAAAGYGLWVLTRSRPVAVTLVALERGRVEATVVNTRAGTVNACRRARLAPAVGGSIARLPVREGDRVQAGQILLELWNDDLRAALVLAEREAEAAAARAEEACATAEVAEREAARLDRLLRQGVATEEAVDRSAGEARARRAGCSAATSSAQVSTARVAVARANLDRTILRAPFAGTVAEVNGELGEVVTPSPIGVPTLPAIDLLDDRCLYVTAPIDEVDAPAVRPGLPVRVSLDAFPGRRYPGVVQRVAPYVLDLERQARTVDVEVAFDAPEDLGGLLPGYSADVEVILDTREAVLRVPTQAVLEGHRVLVYRERPGRRPGAPGEGVLEERPFEPGLASWEHIEVRSGLEEGESLVLSVDREGVRDGARAAPEGGGGTRRP